MATFKVSTKANKDAAPVVTVLTVDTNCDRSIVDALAMQALVVKWQGHARKNGIPETASIKMADYAPGTRHAAGPVDVKAEIAKLGPDERKALLEQLKAMG